MDSSEKNDSNKNKVKNKRTNSCPDSLKILLVIFGITLIVFSTYSAFKFLKNNNNQIIFFTDLSIGGDFDDYFDFVIMENMNIKNLTIVLDDANTLQRNKETSGINVINDYFHITNASRNCDVIRGKESNFSSNINEPVTDYITDKINRAEHTTLISVGSLRDIAAVLNNNRLIENKIDRIYVFAGNFEDTPNYTEANVALDQKAYENVINTDYPLYMVPCFQNGLWTYGNDCSYFCAT